mgnify:CR=1 FL=1
MLDIKKIKENPDAVKAGLRAKEVDCDATVDRILELDGKIRALKTNTETQTAQKNKLAKENGKLFGMKKKAEKEGKDVSELDADEIIVATGSVPRTMPIPGFNKCMTLTELLREKKETGDKVVIFGGGLCRICRTPISSRAARRTTSRCATLASLTSLTSPPSTMLTCARVWV